MTELPHKAQKQLTYCMLIFAGTGKSITRIVLIVR
jgi:hypothetical protein